MFCWKCGAEMADGLTACPSCSSPTLPPSFGSPTPRIEDDPAIRMLIPVGRSIWAILAGYLGLFSVLLVFAPLAVLTAVLALRDIKVHPEKLGKGRAVFGLIMGVLGSIGLVWMLLAMALRSH